MADENVVVTETVTEPPPQPPVTQRKPKPTAGEQLAIDIESTGLTIPDEERKEIAAISDAELVRQFLELKLDRSLNPETLTKMSVFSTTLFQRIELPNILMCIHMHTLGQGQQVLEHVANLKAGRDFDGEPLERPLSEEGKISVLKLQLAASVELSKMLPRATKLAQPTDASKVLAAPKNKAPDTLAQPPTLVQNNGGTVHVH